MRFMRFGTFRGTLKYDNQSSQINKPNRNKFRVADKIQAKLRWQSDCKKLLYDILGEGGCGAAGNNAAALHSVIIIGLANKMQMLFN